MATLNIVSTRDGAGKTCLAGALARRHGADGKRTAYYKPLSANPEADLDLHFIANLLESLGSPQEKVPPPYPQPINPLQHPDRLSEPHTQEISEALHRLEEEYDVVLVEWDAPVAPEGFPVLLVHPLGGGSNLASAASSISESCGKIADDLVGIVINNVPRHRRLEVQDTLVNRLSRQGLPVRGAIPEDREMLALNAGQVADFLGGRWVQEPVDSELWIDRFLIGGNILDSGPNYFGRYANQAVITRAARPDIQMASLMCDTKLLVLTGGEEPTEYIRVEAQQRDASLLLVEGNTLDIAESLGGLLERANPYAEHKLARFTELAEEHLDGGLDGILS